MKLSERIRNKGGIFTAYEWEMWRQATADEVAQREEKNEALRNGIADLIDIMKTPAIRGAKTTLQMCKFLDVWISELEDALLADTKEQSNVR